MKTRVLNPEIKSRIEIGYLPLSLEVLKWYKLSPEYSQKEQDRRIQIRAPLRWSLKVLIFCRLRANDLPRKRQQINDLLSNRVYMHVLFYEYNIFKFNSKIKYNFLFWYHKLGLSFIHFI